MFRCCFLSQSSHKKRVMIRQHVKSLRITLAPSQAKEGRRSVHFHAIRVGAFEFFSISRLRRRADPDLKAITKLCVIVCILKFECACAPEQSTFRPQLVLQNGLFACRRSKSCRLSQQ